MGFVAYSDCKEVYPGRLEMGGDFFGRSVLVLKLTA
jgi:hypothetical protein